MLMTNVVLITVDCLRADHLGCMGYARDTSPFLDKLSKKSMFFTNAFANGPNTRHSVPSFLSSTYPLLFTQEAKGRSFHPGRTSIAEVLKKHGYATAGIHSNPYVSAFYGYDRGFDFFNDFLLGQVEDDVKTSAIKKKYKEAVKGFKAVFFHRLPHETGEEINHEVFNWMEERNHPFFLWVHYMDVHMPYVPSNKYLKELNLPTCAHMKKIWMGKKIDDVNLRDEIKDDDIPDYVNLYDGTIRYTDRILKELIEGIEKKHSDTLFIVTADHGEEFREHGGLSHVEKLYNELLHVPLFFYGKNVEGKKVEKPVSLLSIAPEILQYLQIEKENSFQGKPFNESSGYIISEALRDHRLTSYRDRDWKLILSKEKKELYHLSEDPGEQENVFDRFKNNQEIKDREKILHHHILNMVQERKKRQTLIQKNKIKGVAQRLK